MMLAKRTELWKKGPFSFSFLSFSYSILFLLLVAASLRTPLFWRRVTCIFNIGLQVNTVFDRGQYFGLY